MKPIPTYNRREGNILSFVVHIVLKTLNLGPIDAFALFLVFQDDIRATLSLLRSVDTENKKI